MSDINDLYGDLDLMTLTDVDPKSLGTKERRAYVFQRRLLEGATYAEIGREVGLPAARVARMVIEAARNDPGNLMVRSALIVDGISQVVAGHLALLADNDKLMEMPAEKIDALNESLKLHLGVLDKMFKASAGAANRQLPPASVDL